MRIKLIIFEILLTISAPVFLIAARHSALRIKGSPAAAVQIRAGGNAESAARADGALTGPARGPESRSPELVSRAFRITPGLEERSAMDAAMGGKKESPIEDRLKSLGLIRDADNIERLYIKNIDTDAIMAVRTDGNPEGGNYLVSVLEDLYVLNLDGVLYKLRRE
jgi:hypothetical protein